MKKVAGVERKSSAARGGLRACIYDSPTSASAVSLGVVDSSVIESPATEVTDAMHQVTGKHQKRVTVKENPSLLTYLRSGREKGVDC